MDISHAFEIQFSNDLLKGSRSDWSTVIGETKEGTSTFRRMKPIVKGIQTANNIRYTNIFIKIVGYKIKCLSHWLPIC